MNTIPHTQPDVVLREVIVFCDSSAPKVEESNILAWRVSGSLIDVHQLHPITATEAGDDFNSEPRFVYSDDCKRVIGIVDVYLYDRATRRYQSMDVSGNENAIIEHLRSVLVAELDDRKLTVA